LQRQRKGFDSVVCLLYNNIGKDEATIDKRWNRGCGDNLQYQHI